jgi:ABC-type transporter Mla MlaB component
MMFTSSACTVVASDMNPAARIDSAVIALLVILISSFSGFSRMDCFLMSIAQCG